MKYRIIVIFTLLMMVASGFSSLNAQEQSGSKTQRTQILEKVKLKLMLTDSFLAVEYINSLGECVEVAKHYNNLILDLYWKDKSLPYAVVMGRAGIQHILEKAREFDKSDTKKAAKLRSFAKQLSYNLASFTWPGWDEPGIVVKKDYIVVGLDAAKLNLRLATKLKKGVLKISIAHWMLGAQHLANIDYPQALKSFSLARDLAKKAKSRSNELLALGFIGITQILEGSDIPAGERLYESAIKGFRKIGSKEAEAYIQQLATARKVFENRNK